MSDPTRNDPLGKLRSALAEGQLSRREFVRRAAALGIAASSATAMSGALAASESVPRKGGTLRVASLHGQTTDTLDPAHLFNGFQWTLAYGLRNTLTQIEPGQRLAPCLATEWDANADGTRWNFKLRRGVEFHDGKTLSIDDVVASINHHRGADSDSSAKPIADQIKTLKGVGPDQLVVELNNANVDFPYSLASANFTICKAVDGGIDADSGIGTGGYVLKRFEPGVGASLERNPNYWRDDRAHAAAVEMLAISDGTARINALISGSVDVVDDVEFKVADRLAGMNGISVEETSGPLHYLFSMMSDRPPFNDINVRLAMKYACDREALVQKILSGHGTVGNDQPIGASYRFHDAGLEQRSYDPDRARHHLKQAGLDGLDVDVSASAAAYAGALDAAVLLQESASKAGININVLREPNDGYWSEVYMKKPIYANYWGGYTVASEMLSTGYLPDAAWNDSAFVNERFVDVLRQSNAEFDQQKRREMLAELQAIIRDEAGQLIFAFPNMILARNGNVAHGELATDRPLDGRHLLERWWVV